MTRSYTTTPGTYRSPFFSDGTIDNALLATLRRTAGLTQQQVAHILRVERNTFNRWETGRVTTIPTIAHRSALVDWCYHVQRKYGSPEEGAVLPGDQIDVPFVHEDGTHDVWAGIVLVLVRGQPYTDFELDHLAYTLQRGGFGLKAQCRDIGCMFDSYRYWRQRGRRPGGHYQYALGQFVTRYTNHNNRPLAPATVAAIREGFAIDDERITPNE